MTCVTCGHDMQIVYNYIYHDQYKGTSLSSFNNQVYYCNTNDCINRVKNSISE